VTIKALQDFKLEPNANTLPQIFKS